MKLSDLKVKIYADGADLKSMLDLASKDYIGGVTCNPSLMAAAGVKDYKEFSLQVLKEIKTKSVSFEVVADDEYNMYRQAMEIASWAPNVMVKIPITNSKGEPSAKLIKKLAKAGVNINVTAVFTLMQVTEAAKALSSAEDKTQGLISVFCGRLSDVGINPVPHMIVAKKICKMAHENIQLLWASPRQLYNIIEADNAGADIITVGHDILSKIHLLGKDPTEYSLETVQMFKTAYEKCGYTL